MADNKHHPYAGLGTLQHHVLRLWWLILKRDAHTCLYTLPPPADAQGEGVMERRGVCTRQHVQEGAVGGLGTVQLH